MIIAGALALVSSSVLGADNGWLLGLDVGESRAQLSGGANPTIRPMSVSETEHQDRSDTAYGFHVGYEFAKHVVAEVAYVDAGESARTVTRVPSVVTIFAPFNPVPALADRVFYSDLINVPTDVVVILPAFTTNPEIFATKQETTFTSKVLTLSIKGQYRIGDHLGFFGGAGIASHQIEVRNRLWLGNMSFDSKAHDHVTGGELAAGADWLFSPHWSWRLQYARHFDVDTTDQATSMRSDIELLTTGVTYSF
jgi:opacity protein-like surface antigen